MALTISNDTTSTTIYSTTSYQTNVLLTPYNDRSTPAVAFTASYDNNENPYTGSGIIPFPSVLYNYGGGLNGSTGRFTAPVSGLYFFSILFMSTSTAANINKYYRLSKNGNYSSSTGSLNQYVYSTDYDASYKNWPGGTLFYLSVGDYVDVYTGNVGLYMNSYYYTRFCGFLVSA